MSVHFDSIKDAVCCYINVRVESFSGSLSDDVLLVLPDIYRF
jgi:hypothetical protein